MGLSIFGWSFYTLYQNFRGKPAQILDINNYYFSLIFLGSLGVLNFILPLIINISTAFSVFFNCFVQYMFMQSTYSILFITYSFSNIDDVSWGNREALMTPEEKAENAKREQQFKCYKLTVLIIWLILNILYSWFFSWIIENHRAKFDLIQVFAYVIAVLITFRLVFSTLDKIKYVILDKLCLKIYKYECGYIRDEHESDQEAIKYNIINKDTNIIPMQEVRVEEEEINEDDEINENKENLEIKVIRENKEIKVNKQIMENLEIKVNKEILEKNNNSNSFSTIKNELQV